MWRKSRACVGQGLRQDLAAQHRGDSARKAREVLEKYKVDPKVIEEVVASVG